MRARAITFTLALVLGAGCGGDDHGSRSLSLLVAGQATSSLDPQRTDYPTLVRATQRTLYRPRATAGPLLPDLAVGQPRLGADGRTITVTIRRGVRFSPPVSREVTVRDVRYAIERGLLPSVADPLTAAYFGDLVGVDAYRRGKATHVAGLRVPSPRTLVLRLRRPTAGFVSRALSLPLTAPVPEEYARAYDRRTRSTYAEHFVSTGPYMVRRDRAGRAVAAPGVALELVRNPSWRRSTDIRPAHVDRIELRPGFDVLDVLARKVLRGRGMISVQPPPPKLLRRLLSGSGRRQIALVPTPTLSYLAINTTLPGLDDVDVRRAVLAGFDRSAVQAALGGPTVTSLASDFLAPGIPGFTQAGGARGAGVDFLARPGGDLRLARRYLRRAGYRSGRYTRPELLTLIGFSGPYSHLTDIAEAQLRRLGFRLRVRRFDPPTAFGRFCQRPAARVAFCIFQWTADFADPQTMLDPTYNGRRITPEGNTNVSQLSDPAIDAAMARAETLTSPAARAQAWAEIDRDLVRLAPAVPLVRMVDPLVASRDVHQLVSPVTGLPDPTWMRVG